MRAICGWALILVLTASLLAGCVEPGDPEGDPDAPGDGDDGAGDNGDDSGSTTDSSQDDRACEDRNPPVAYPDEQQVDNRSDIRCLGHFVVLENGTGAQADVPTWEIDAWWHYKGDILDTMTGTGLNCGERRLDVTGEATKHNRSVYETRANAWECGDEPNPVQARERFYTQEGLNWMFTQPDGFIRHELHFPLADGKQWAFMDNSGQIVDAEVTHIEQYSFGDDEFEVWRVDLSGTNAQGMDWTQRSWFSPDAKNVLREEFHQNGIQQYFWELIDSSDGFGGETKGPLGSGLPLPK